MTRTRRSLRPRWTLSKTQIVAVLLMVFGAVQANMGIFTGWLTAETVGWIGSGVGLVMYILRACTTCSLETKKETYDNRHIRERTNKGKRDSETESV